MLKLGFYYPHKVWYVYTEDGTKKIFAEIHLDYLYQVKSVVLYPELDPAVRREILNVAASHHKQYVVDRRVSIFNDFPDTTMRSDLEDSVRLMAFESVPQDIKDLSEERILSEFKRHYIDVTTLRFETCEAALAEILHQVQVEGLSYEAATDKHVISPDELYLKFSVKAPQEFTYWRNEMKPSREYEGIHVVPGYHPVMKGHKDIGMINGDTDAYIRGDTILEAYCPEAARTLQKALCASWSHVNHPYYAKGPSTIIKVTKRKLRSEKGIKDVVDFLRATLGLEATYVSVSGGFRAPLLCAHNLLLKKNMKSPWPDAHVQGAHHVARGSEEHCVWACRVLKKEGELKRAHVPLWFIDEGWLEIYEGAEVQPGLY
jgi:hypothetical protein